MKLETKFFKSFFFSFLISIILCTLVVIIFLGTFSYDKYDKRVIEKIINLERKISKSVINSANIIILNKFLKFQMALNEQIVFYQKKAQELLTSEEEELDNNFLKCLVTLEMTICYDKDEARKCAFWLLDYHTDEENLDEKIDVKRQLIAYSHIIPNIDTIYETTQPNTTSYFFYFEETELYISFPILDGCNSFYLYYMRYSYMETEGCNDENGIPYDTFKLKCEQYFMNMMKSKTHIFDKNNLSQNKTIFISNFFTSEEYNHILQERFFTMCIQFDDPITEGKGYACVDTYYTDIIKSMEELNLKVPGFFFVSNIGFSNLLYFPLETSTPKTPTEEIYNWVIGYILSEKAFFRDNIDIILTSNYIDYIGRNNHEEIFVNGKNSSEQTFYINDEKYKYSIYPIIFINSYGKREHVFSLIYVFNNQLFLDKFEDNSFSNIMMIILEIVIFIVFGLGLLYLINLSFDTLVKYIVIPIKNVNYMLRGINIGGKNRLKYLEFLEQKHDEILEKLENVCLQEIKNNNIKYKKKLNGTNKNKKEDDFIDKDKLIDEESKETIYSKNQGKNNIFDINQIYDEESNYLEKEYRFYDYDEQLLQYRPLEIEYLVKSLMDLKEAMIFTSQDREVKNIINYFYSEHVFRNFQNKEGAIICQSNIGNLQSQLLKYDKAIYHLSLSLQDSQLKKFLN